MPCHYHLALVYVNINVTPMYMYIAQPCNYLICRGYHSK
jgi:hypothetical protein